MPKEHLFYPFSQPVINSTMGMESYSLHDTTKYVPSGLQVITAHVPTLPYVYEFPAAVFENDLIHVHLGNTTTRLEGSIGSAWFHGYSSPGSCFITPRTEPTAWRHQGDFEAVVMQLSRTIVAETSLQVFGRDPARVNLRSMSLQPDILLYGIAQALVAELRGDRGPVSNLYLDTLNQALLVHVLRN